MARITDVNIILSGHEPKFDTEITQGQLASALNWYSQNKMKKDAEKYAHDYLKKKHKVEVSDPLGDEVATFGFVCRIVYNGATLPEKNQIWFENKIEEIKNYNKKKKVVDVVVEEKTGPSIQERMAEKISEVAGELEGLLDDYILSDLKTIPSPYGLLHTKGAKGAYAKQLIEIWKKHRAEYEEALLGKDEQIVEAYAHYKKPGLKKLIAFCDLVITDCMKLAGESVKNRKPRKRKVKSPDELVAKMKYCKDFAELKLVSITPREIIGVMQLWVYNTKTRKLGCYHAEDAGGLTVKGSSIINYSETKSVMKKLRKPEQMLPEVLKGGKVFLRNVIDNIKAVESPLSGRINEDTILLRVMK